MEKFFANHNAPIKNKYIRANEAFFMMTNQRKKERNYEAVNIKK